MMVWLRSLIYYPFLFLSIIIFGLAIVLLGGFLPQSYSDTLANTWARLNVWLQKMICGLKYEIQGQENLAENQAVIVMAKHQSAWETIALRCIVPPKQSWVLKQELLKLPFFGWALHFCQSIPIDRKAGRRAVLDVVKKGGKQLKAGRTVIIFPEGTRTAPGQRKKYGLGGGILAQHSGFPVVPIAHNAGVFWRRQGIKKYPGTIQVRVGPAISSTDKKAEQINQEVETWIETEMEKLSNKMD
jgi:1-acyl-sn-glycerol-3-phosphate acyltransferase